MRMHYLKRKKDGKHSFFLGDGIHGVSTSFIEELRPKELEK